MKKRFIIPALCALLLHAALLLGFRPVEKIPEGSDCILEVDPKPLPRIPDDPIEVTVWSSDISAPNDDVRKGETDRANPSSEDRSPFVDDREDFTVVKEPVVRTERTEMTVINPGPVGKPEGNPEGIRFSGDVFDSAKLDRVPRALAQISPRYPAEAKMRGLDGEVVVEFTVDESGRVTSCRVVSSSSREFESAAVNAVKQWRFEPGRRNGRVVRFSMAVPVMFRLND